MGKKLGYAMGIIGILLILGAVAILTQPVPHGGSDATIAYWQNQLNSCSGVIDCQNADSNLRSAVAARTTSWAFIVVGALLIIGASVVISRAE